MAALGTFVPGKYTATYGGTAVGMVENGFWIRWRGHKKEIRGTNAFGEMKIDGIYRGVDAYVECVFKEWNATVQKIIWPWVTISADTDKGKLGIMGQLDSGLAAALVLTPLSGSPAASNSGGIWTFTYTTLAAENDVRFFAGLDERNVPVLLDVVPYNDGTYDRLFTFT